MYDAKLTVVLMCFRSQEINAGQGKRKTAAINIKLEK